MSHDAASDGSEATSIGIDALSVDPLPVVFVDRAMFDSLGGKQFTLVPLIGQV